MTAGGRKRHLINANDAVLHFLRTYNIRVKATMIRQWAARKHIGSHGLGRERYDIREIEAYAIDRGIIPNPKDPHGHTRNRGTDRRP